MWWAKIMSQLAPVMLTADQFNQLATKDYLDKSFAKKDDLKDFATKDYLDERLKDFAKKIEQRFDLFDKKFTERFDILDYKIDTNVAQSYKDTNAAILNHEIRIKKLESKYI